MPASHVLGLLLFAALLSAGQILFKSAALSAPALTSGSGFLALLQLPVLWAALALYGAATFLWIYLMQSVPLSRGYPFAALGFVLVPLAGVFMFGERISGVYVGGALLVVLGLLLISQG